MQKLTEAKSRHLSCLREGEQYGWTARLIAAQRGCGGGREQGQQRKGGIYHSWKEKKWVMSAEWV